MCTVQTCAIPEQSKGKAKVPTLSITLIFLHLSEHCALNNSPSNSQVLLLYQHTPDSLSARATQFYITKIDAANREHKLEDKGEPEPCKVPPSSLTASGRVVDLPGQGARDCLAQGEPRCDGGP